MVVVATTAVTIIFIIAQRSVVTEMESSDLSTPLIKSLNFYLVVIPKDWGDQVLSFYVFTRLGQIKDMSSHFSYCFLVSWEGLLIPNM